MNENRFFATFFFWGGGGLKRELERHCSFIIMVNKNTIRVCEAEICILNSDILYIDSGSKREQIFLVFRGTLIGHFRDMHLLPTRLVLC